MGTVTQAGTPSGVNILQSLVSDFDKNTEMIKVVRDDVENLYKDFDKI
jgi:hypothetical protein